MNIHTYLKQIPSALIVGPICFFTLYFCVNYQYIAHSCNRGGDYALTLLETEKASNFEALTGPYSRFRFRHPAPTFFYLYSGLGKLAYFADTQQGKASVAQFLVNSILVTVAILALLNTFNLPFLTLVLFYTFLYFVSFGRPGIWHDIWGPSSVVAAVFCFVCSSVPVSQGNFNWSFWWILSALLSLSNHLGTLPTLAPSLLLVPFLCATNFYKLGDKTGVRSGRVAKFSILLSMLALGAVSLPPLLEAVTLNGGNLKRIFHFVFLADSAESAQPIPLAMRYIGSFVAKPLRLHSWIGVGITFLSFSLLALMWRRLKGSRYYTRSKDLAYRNFAMIILAIYLGASFGAYKIEGKVYHYLMMYMYGVAPLLLYAPALYLVRIFGSPNFSILKGNLRRHLTSCLAAALAIQFSFLTYRQNGKKPTHCKDRVALIIDKMEIDRSTPLHLRPADKTDWGALATSALSLYSEGYRICIANDWEFMFGPSLACQSRTSVLPPWRVFYVYSVKGAKASLPEGAIRSGKIAWRESTTVQLEELEGINVSR